MGNHEYCEACGESNFHLNRPCDPAKVTARDKEKQERENQHRFAVAELRKLRKVIETTLKVKCVFGEHDCLTIEPYQFYKRYKGSKT